ncbi:MAG TPA: hypothetical protein VMZ52_20025 [Bryobacteraceae bacterium]|nr:hypothetical protein [Bryobacteraceae bacterium]
MPDILTRLKQSVDDPKLFDLTYIDDKTAAKAQFREAFEGLYTAAYLASRGAIEDPDDPAYGVEAQYPGAAIFEVYPLAASDWLESIRDALHAVATKADEEDQLFLSFMEGYLMCGWDEHLRKRRAA